MQHVRWQSSSGVVQAAAVKERGLGVGLGLGLETDLAPTSESLVLRVSALARRTLPGLLAMPLFVNAYANPRGNHAINTSSPLGAGTPPPHQRDYWSMTSHSCCLRRLFCVLQSGSLEPRPAL